MAKSEKQKLKLLYLVDILREKTDAEHTLSMAEIIALLKERNVSAERKSLYDDFLVLEEYGFIVERTSDRKHYYTEERQFQLSELKLMIDSIQSSKFITERKTRELIGKMESLCSEHEARQLHRQVVITRRVKSMNNSVLYNVDALHAAISGDEQIVFKYFNYDIKKRRIFRDKHYLLNLENSIHKQEDMLPMEVDNMPTKLKERVEVGRTAENKPLYRWACGHDTRALHHAIARLHVHYGLLEGLPIASSAAVPEKKPVLFKTYVSKWLDTYKAPKVKPTTLLNYHGMLNTHLYPAFGKRAMDSITTDDVQAFLNERANLAQKSLKHLLTLLGTIFADAAEDGIVKKSPTKSRKLTIPSIKEEKPREALLEGQVLDILQQIHVLETHDRRMMALLLLTGMRRGEVLGLRWEDIDAIAGLIHVCRNVTYAKNQPYIGTPKSKKGLREVPLDPQLWELLQPTGTKGFIIGGEQPISYMAYKRAWERIEKRINLYGATAHVFRHSYLTILSNAGVEPKTIQAIGGHADITTTMNIYVHKQTAQIIDAGRKISGKFRPAEQLENP